MPTIIPIPAFADNYMWLVLHNGKAAVVGRTHSDNVHAGRKLPGRVAMLARFVPGRTHTAIA
jgi:hypothetical protein